MAQWITMDHNEKYKHTCSPPKPNLNHPPGRPNFTRNLATYELHHCVGLRLRAGRKPGWIWAKCSPGLTPQTPLAGHGCSNGRICFLQGPKRVVMVKPHFIVFHCDPLWFMVPLCSIVVELSKQFSSYSMLFLFKLSDRMCWLEWANHRRCYQ